MVKRGTLIIITIIFGLSAIILFLLLSLFKKQPVEVIPPVTPYPTFIFQPSVTQTPLGEKIMISDIPVNNFLKTAIKINPSGNILIKDGGTYQITVYTSTGQFLLSIQQSPFEETRNIAEKAFLDLLGVEKNQACKLDVSITTPFFANPDLADEIFPLSFCQE